MIDPQGQANKWIKNMEKPKNLAVIRLNQPDYVRVLENAIQFGQPVIIGDENILIPVIFIPYFTGASRKCGRGVRSSVGAGFTTASLQTRWCMVPEAW